MSEEEVVAFGEGEFWLGGDEIVVAWAEMEFILTAFRELPEDPTPDEIRAAIEDVGTKDSNRILALINGTAEKAFLRIRK